MGEGDQNTAARGGPPSPMRGGMGWGEPLAPFSCRALEPLLHHRLERQMQLFILDWIEDLLKESADQHALGVDLWDAAAHQIEQRFLIERADSRAMAADDVVGKDLEFGLGKDL